MAGRISLVVPCYNEQQAIPLFYAEACKAAEELRQRFSVEVEFVFVNDGSTDGTLGVLRGLAAQDGRVRYLSLSRNFGKEAAMYAGMEHAAGDYVAVMDADLQDPPALLPQMYAGIQEEGYDCVATRRVSRKGDAADPVVFARRFYRLMNRISQLDLVDGARDYRLMTRQMVEAILRVTEYNRFSKGIFSWWASPPNGWNTKTSGGRREKPSGRSGSCSSIRWRALSRIRSSLWRSPPFWACCFA